MEQEQTKFLVIRAIEELRSAYADVRSVKGIRGAVTCAKYVVQHVEKLGATLKLAGPDKKALAVEIIVAMVPWPVWLPEFVARWVVGWLIERALAGMKKLGGRIGGTK